MWIILSYVIRNSASLSYPLAVPKQQQELCGKKKKDFATTVRRTNNPLLTPVSVIGLCCAVWIVTTETVQKHNSWVAGHLRVVWDLWKKGQE